MEKEKAVATLGQVSLLLPAWIKAALQANDRLKLQLSVLQSAATHAQHPELGVPDWSAELQRMGLPELAWLKECATAAYLQDELLLFPHFETMMDVIQADLGIMARPVCDAAAPSSADFSERRNIWLQKIQLIKASEGLSLDLLAELTHGQRKQGDSLHLLVMDLHKSLNALAAAMATQDIDGAHVWQVADDDRPLIQAFMRGLNRTAPLKFNHPGLETAITREGKKLLIQNDIGTNDAHVLVIEVEGRTVRLTYSDLHPPRFDFFRQLLETVGFEWTVLEPQTTDGLNQGQPYIVGYALCKVSSKQALQDQLEAAGARIVFLIDWNRARKRLQSFVRKAVAVNILRHCADKEMGHMAWLIAGGDRLVYDAMQSVGSEAFRIGDRLDQVLGEAAAQDYLQALMCEASVKLRQQLPVALVADEARVLLARAMRQRSFEFDLLGEHAAIGHALAHLLSETLCNAASQTTQTLDEVVSRAKVLERKADHVLMTARERAGRNARWLPLLNLLELMDDVADTLEEAAFLLSLTRAEPLSGLPPAVLGLLSQLADTTLTAIQDQIKAIEIARHMSSTATAYDQEDFLQALWRTLQAERRCDDLLRATRLKIIGELHDQPALFTLANEFAAALEQATDSLLAAGHVLRTIILNPSGVAA
jgi:uncharacterized protein Yka (UPF0111/DUF47 family)